MTTTALNQNVRAFTSENGSLVTAENRSVAIDGASLVYRCFGNKQTNTPPLLFLQHFRGNLDNWDPALVDRLAQDREVILLANRGVGASTGVVPDNVTDMTRDVLRFVDALGLKQVDVLGFSLGGFGLGTALSAFAIASQNGVDVAQMGVATGLGTSGRAIGATLGSAGFGSLLVARIGADTVTPQVLAGALHDTFSAAVLVLLIGAVLVLPLHVTAQVRNPVAPLIPAPVQGQSEPAA